MPQRPTSSLAACVWIPLFPLRCEEARREGLATHPTALLAPDLSRKLWQVSPLARHTGVRPGMTVSQAIGLCPTLRLCEPDPVHYDERFASLLAALNEISPVVESGELGLAYLGTDGLEGIYGTPGRIVEVIKRTMESWNVGTSEAGCPFQRSIFPSFRLGWGKGKFAAWVAASRAKPGEAVIVPAGGEGKFLSAQPIAALTFFTPVGERDLIERAIDQLIARALKDSRRIGWRVQAVRLVAELESWGGDEDPTNRSWLVTVLLKDPTADGARIAAPLRTRLEQAPPAGAVTRLILEFTAFAPGTTELQLFARDAVAAARAGQRRALESAAREIHQRLKRTCLYHVIEVQPWSRLPERRYALIDFEP